MIWSRLPFGNQAKSNPTFLQKLKQPCPCFGHPSLFGWPARNNGRFACAKRVKNFICSKPAAEEAWRRVLPIPGFGSLNLNSLAFGAGLSFYG